MYLSKITDRKSLWWHKRPVKISAFIFNSCWHIHVQTLPQISKCKKIICKWVKGSFFRNIYFENYLIYEAKISQDSLYMFRPYTILQIEDIWAENVLKIGCITWNYPHIENPLKNSSQNSPACPKKPNKTNKKHTCKGCYHSGWLSSVIKKVKGSANMVSNLPFVTVNVLNVLYQC